MALTALGFEKITVSTSAVGLTSSKITSKVIMAKMTVEDDAIRVREDGSDPTATDGLKISAGDWPPYEVWGHPNLLAFRAIRVSTDAVLQVQYYGTAD